MEKKIITTSDGSHSIYIPEMDEHYHSVHGAIQESKHVFIEAGLHYLLSKKTSALNILEIGLGTGLNALLTFIEAEKKEVRINYTSVEAFPIDDELISALNYVKQLPESPKMDISSSFRTIHSCAWGKENELSEYFSLLKLKGTLQNSELEKEHFDLIYFDAFGPPTQPEMWTDEIFLKLALSIKTGGGLVTYCAKGEVKRTLKRTGFTVETLPGPPGKREMIRAVKN